MTLDKPFQWHRLALAILVLLSISCFLNSCASKSSATFKNPKFRCPSRDVVEPGEGYPFSVQAYPSPGGQRSVAELKDFCQRMRQRFADSNFTNEEAAQFYALLKEIDEKRLPSGQVLSFANGTYGFPTGSGDPFVFEKQVMLKKISEQKYEIFYYYIGCGRWYTHLEIHLDRGNVIEVVTLESWGESYPC
ncbi:MAG: hypothetical protein M8467_13170 [Anaerolineae bacterium]|nr:hypothetical protein [Anaerolineae bacterium]